MRSGERTRHTPRFRAAGIAFGALIALALPLSSDAVAQAAGRELARTGVLEPTYEPIGFDGADVVAVRETRIVVFGAAGMRLVSDVAGLDSALVAGGTLALVVRRGGASELRAGPVAGPLRSLATCPPPQPAVLAPPAAAIAGGRVVWPACDQRSIVVFGPDGVERLDAGGSVRAVAAAGDRVAWVAADASTPAVLVVHVFDLGSRTAAITARLGAADAAARVRVAIAADGRMLATAERIDGYEVSCTRLAAGQAIASVARGVRCPERVVFTGEGSIESRPGLRGSAAGGVVRRARSGKLLTAIAKTSAMTLARRFATDGTNVAVSLLGCRGARLVTGPLATATFPRPDCAVRLRGRSVTASRRGVVTIAVRCPQGCVGFPGGMDLRFGRTSIVPNSESFLDLRPGASGRVVFKLEASQLRRIARRGAVTARVSIVGNEDRSTFTIRLRAPRSAR